MLSQDTPRRTEDAPEYEPLYFEPHPPGPRLTGVQNAGAIVGSATRLVDRARDLREQGPSPRRSPWSFDISKALSGADPPEVPQAQWGHLNRGELPK